MSQGDVPMMIKIQSDPNSTIPSLISENAKDISVIALKKDSLKNCGW